jgi:hypothetical protein
MRGKEFKPLGENEPQKAIALIEEGKRLFFLKNQKK